VSEVTVSRYVARRRVELGLVHREVSIPQTHLAGAEGEVDFGEFYATVAGVWVKCWMFVMRLSHSGRAFHVAFGTRAQEAFLEGHVLAFEHFGGIPARVRYDNLKPAVVRVLKGRDRTESERFAALRSHYGFDSPTCRSASGARCSLTPARRRDRRPRHLQRPHSRDRHQVLSTPHESAQFTAEAVHVLTGSQAAGRRQQRRVR
jgi:transposase